jgi:hypothetical protein
MMIVVSALRVPIAFAASEPPGPNSRHPGAEWCEGWLRVSHRFDFVAAEEQYLSSRSRVYAIDSVNALHLPGRPWTDAEELDVSATLEHLFTQYPLRAFFGRVFYSGHIRMLRAQHYVSYDPVLGARVENGYAMYNPDYGGVLFFDALFSQNTEAINTPGPESFRTYAILHELAHVVDGPDFRYSKDREFLRLTGWRRRQGMPGQPTTYFHPLAETDVYRTIKEQIERLVKQDRRAEAYQLSHTWARFNKLPTRYALTDPQETFAETLSYMILDPNSDRYIPQELRQWFQQKVLR